MDSRLPYPGCDRTPEERRLTYATNGSSGASSGAPDDLALPRPPGAIRRYLHGHPWLTDSLVAVVYLLFAAVFAVIAAVAPDLPPLWAVIALGVAGTTVVLLRRQYPVLMFALANVLVIIGSAVGTTAEILLPLLTIYAVGVYRPSRSAWICFGAGAAAAIVSGLIAAARAPALPGTAPEASQDLWGAWFNGAATAIVFLLVATLIGTNVGSRKRYVAALLERAAQLARERDAQAEIASARERERIAREMHDVIAHSLSVMIALTEGARAVAPEHPDRAQDAMDRAADTGRRTLGEVRRLLGSVRGDGGDRGDRPATRVPQPGVDELPALVAEFTRAGLPVTLSMKGTPIRDTTLELTLFRLVQESLTNALRHAAEATRVTVTLQWEARSVAVTIDDDGSATIARPGDVGRGILGMRERVALYGGEFEAGPGPTHGWRVCATLPFERSAP